MDGISVETEGDSWEVEALYDLCFAPGRTGLSSYQLRQGAPEGALCLVWRDDIGVLGGAIRHWAVSVGDAQALLLGPIAVHPTRQGEGLGAVLMETALHKATELGWQRVLLVGDAPYYQRFGFSRLDGVQMPLPTNPDRILGRALAEAAWDGVAGLVRPVD